MVTLDGADLTTLRQQSQQGYYDVNADAYQYDNYDEDGDGEYLDYVTSSTAYGPQNVTEPYNPTPFYRPDHAAGDGNATLGAASTDVTTLPKNVGMVRPQPLTVEPVRINLNDDCEFHENTL